MQVIDLGLQAEKAFESKKIKMNPKIKITWELPNELIQYEDKETGEKKSRPQLVSQEYKASLHEKAKLRKMLASWRGRDFSEEELKKFEMVNVLNVACMINLVVIEKEGKKYNNIAAVTPIAKGMTCPDQITPPIYFDLSEFDFEVFETLPDFIKEKIKKSTEWAKIHPDQLNNLTDEDFE